MATYESRIPKFPLPCKSIKESVKNAPPSTEKKTEPTIPTLKTPSRFQKSHSIENTGCRSESSKKKAFQKFRTLSTVQENDSIPKIKVKLTIPPCVRKSKRPGWDINGRIQDMEVINSNLKGKLEAFTDRIVVLEKDKRQLHQDAKVKSVQSREASESIKKLEKELCEKTEELTITLKERDAKLQTLQSVCDPLVNENVLLKSELSSLKLLLATLNNSIPTLQTQLKSTKLLLDQTQDQCEKQEKIIQKFSTDNNRLAEYLKEQEMTSKELQILIQTLKA